MSKPPTIRLLGVDPSSTRTGWVIMTGPTEIVDATICRPLGAKAPPLERAISMAGEVVGITRNMRVTHVVIETPALHAHGHVLPRAQGHGLAVYGMAVGIIAYAVRMAIGWRNMTAVPADEWTPPRTSKKRRQVMIAAEFPQYREIMEAGKDPGGDVADAIGLCLWWFGQQQIKQLEQGNG